MLKRLVLILFMATALPVVAAPELSDADRRRLADATTDRDGVLDGQGGDGLYVLLRHASGWMGDDFAGDAGAKTAPPPDYDDLRQNPDEGRGNAYLIEGWVVQIDRYPTTDNSDRDRLMRAGNPAWGDRLTRWTVVTERENPAATIIVLFNDPRAQMPKPGKDSRVRIAARFYKLWTINDVNGRPFTYPVFVGGASEVVSGPAAGGGGPPTLEAALIAVVTVAMVFVVFRLILRLMKVGGRQRTAALIDARRRERERDALEDEDILDLPDDPVQALDVLRDRHDSD